MFSTAVPIPQTLNPCICSAAVDFAECLQFGTLGFRVGMFRGFTGLGCGLRFWGLVGYGFRGLGSRV